jgi:hypothetical protein
MDITVYTFEAEGDTPFGEYRTQDYEEAKAYARQYGLVIVANTFEWVESERLDDYRDEDAPPPWRNAEGDPTRNGAFG